MKAYTYVNVAHLSKFVLFLYAKLCVHVLAQAIADETNSVNEENEKQKYETMFIDARSRLGNVLNQCKKIMSAMPKISEHAAPMIQKIHTMRGKALQQLSSLDFMIEQGETQSGQDIDNMLTQVIS